MQRKHLLLVLILVVLTGTSISYAVYVRDEVTVTTPSGTGNPPAVFTSLNNPSANKLLAEPKALPTYFDKSIGWLVNAQMDNGGWGAGMGNRQDITDPHAVQTDPATTAFAAMALIRIGNTLDAGPQQENLRKALSYLLKAVGETPANSINITTLQGTQPQYKLGENIDASITAQFFSRVLPLSARQPDLEKQVKEALEKCIHILENSQESDGSWGKSGWATVLNSAMAANSMEMAKASGIKVDSAKFANSKAYQQSNIGEDGSVKTDKAAGIALYSASSAQRSNSDTRKKAQVYLNDMAAPASPEGPSKSEVQTHLEKKGLAKKDAEEMTEAYVTYEAAARQMQRDDVLSGFGNNGGEEFLSYMMTSESFVSAEDAKQWDSWHKKMSGLYEKIQNADGSWSGQHCITSPVFCTAAVIMTLTADRDPLMANAGK